MLRDQRTQKELVLLFWATSLRLPENARGIFEDSGPRGVGNGGAAAIPTAVRNDDIVYKGEDAIVNDGLLELLQTHNSS